MHCGYNPFRRLITPESIRELRCDRSVAWLRCAGYPSRPEKPMTPIRGFQKVKADVVCLLILYFVSLLLFYPFVLSDSDFSAGGDTAQAISYTKAAELIRETEGRDPLWLPYLFGGMPALGSGALFPHNPGYLKKAILTGLTPLYLKRKWSWLMAHYLLAGCSMFLLLRYLKLPRLAALFGSLVVMLSPNAVSLAEAGHGSKLMALSYLPGIFLLTRLLFQETRSSEDQSCAGGQFSSGPVSIMCFSLFEPSSYRLGWILTHAGWSTVVVLALLGLVRKRRKRRR